MTLERRALDAPLCAENISDLVSSAPADAALDGRRFRRPLSPPTRAEIRSAGPGPRAFEGYVATAGPNGKSGIPEFSSACHDSRPETGHDGAAGDRRRGFWQHPARRRPVHHRRGPQSADRPRIARTAGRSRPSQGLQALARPTAAAGPPARRAGRTDAGRGARTDAGPCRRPRRPGGARRPRRSRQGRPALLRHLGRDHPQAADRNARRRREDQLHASNARADFALSGLRRAVDRALAALASTST